MDIAQKLMDFRVIVAADELWGIGKDGVMPWWLPEDMARFKTLTTGVGNAAVIMGRKTWDSLPTRFRPLPGRRNVVLSRAMFVAGDLRGTPLCGSLDAALRFCEDTAITDVWVIGGAEVYRKALQHPSCVGLEITRVGGRHDCDVFFDEKLLAPFECVATERPDAGDFRFETWSRREEQ